MPRIGRPPERAQGIEVPSGGLPWRRLEVAAEYLKIELSTQQHSDFLLRSLVDGKDVRLELSRAELEQVLTESLRTLRQTCAELKKSLAERPEHLVLVGGPMLSPLVCRQVEEVFGMARTGVSDPRHGRGLRRSGPKVAAVLDGGLRETLLLDVTPLPLGIRALNQEDREHFSVLIDKNTTIPVSRQQVYSTRKDNQPNVNIEIFQGQLDDRSKIGQFQLDIPPAKRGEPHIEVSFSIDPSCVLEVTARDQKTGVSKVIKLTDSTLLSPAERDAMTRRFEQLQVEEDHRHQLAQLVEDLGRQVAEIAENRVEGLLGEWREPDGRLPSVEHATRQGDATGALRDVQRRKRVGVRVAAGGGTPTRPDRQGGRVLGADSQAVGGDAGVRVGVRGRRPGRRAARGRGARTAVKASSSVARGWPPGTHCS